MKVLIRTISNRPFVMDISYNTPVDLSEVPEKYRKYFYNGGKLNDALLVDFTEGSSFDFLKMAEGRARDVVAANCEFFLSGGKDTRSPLEKMLSRFKYASIKEGNKQFITYVDNETMKAYRMFDNHYYHGLLWPLEEIKEFTFDHWCSGMEV